MNWLQFIINGKYQRLWIGYLFYRSWGGQIWQELNQYC